MVNSGIIAAIYAALTIVLSPLSYGLLQIRVSEALTILPYFTPAAIPGLFIGCIIGNFNSPLGILDVTLGSTASLIAALITWKIKNKKLVPLPSIVLNALLVPVVLKYTIGAPYLASVLWVALGQTIACYGLGYPLLNVLEKRKVFNK